jgi:hypothetical protein
MNQATYYAIISTIFMARALPRWMCFVAAFAYTGMAFASKMGWL